MRVCPKCRSTYAAKTQFCGLDGERLIETDTDPLLGESVGRYQIIESIGRGATGCVYRAKHTELGSEFAIKVLIGDLGSDEVVVGRFKREAQVASRVRSSNVVSVTDFGTTPEGLAYLVMEYVQGAPLDKVVRKHAPLMPLRAAQLARGIAAGLGAAHEHGFVHRDVKPSNVLVIREGGLEIAKLLDFGIARLETSDEVTQLTKDGRVVGTPSYMAPEQWRGSKVGPSADLYGLGIVMYEMITGKKPFRASEIPQLITKHMHEAPPPLPPCGGLEALVFQLLAKTEDERPESATAVVASLDGLVATLQDASSSYAVASTQPGTGPTEPDMPSGSDIAASSGSGSHASGVSDAYPTGVQGAPGVGGSSASLSAEAPMPTMGSESMPSGSMTSVAVGSSGLGWALVGGAALLGAIAFAVYVGTQDGAGGSEVINSTPPKVEPIPRSMHEIEADLQKALSRVGFSLAELADTPGLEPRLTAWRTAVSQKNVRQAEAALGPLVQAIDGIEVDKAMISSKLEALQAEHGLLGRVVDKVPDRKEALEVRYSSYYTRLNAEKGASQLRRLAQDVHAFFKELEALDKAK